MDKKDDAFMSAFSAAAVEMAHESHLLGTVAHSESFGLSLQSSPHKRMHSLSLSTPVLRDFQTDTFENSELLLDIDEFNQTNRRNYQRDWKPEDDSEPVFGKLVGEIQNGGSVQSGQSPYRHEMGRYDRADVPPETDRSQTRALRISADTTRRSINSDSNGSQFDPADGEDVSLVKHEVSALERTSSEPVSCSVCGDTVAGFHCGAYVCEACKKFFVRCLKQDVGMKFTCAHSQSCEITKETRTQCPSCRFQKCLKLGMYKPGGPNVSSEIGHIPCKVCGAPSSGFHFGAITCEGCKGFFRRTVKERDGLKYQCSRNSSCVITWKTRNICKMCRYRQCLKAGMKPDKSRIGRQPNSVKHATMLELNQIKTAKGLAPLPFPVHEFKSEPVDFIDCGENENHVTMSNSTDCGLAQMSSASSNDLIRCDSVELEIKDGVIMELGLPTNISQLKADSLQKKDRKDKSRHGAYIYECDAANQGISSGKKPPVSMLPASAPGDQYTGKCSEYTPVTTAHFDDFTVNPALDSNPLEPFVLPSRENLATCEKFALPDVGPEGVTFVDIPPSVSITRPVSPLEKSLSPLPNYDTVISIIQHSFKDLSVILSRADMEEVTASSSLSSTWDSMMTQFAHCAQATLRFAKKVPGFRQFAISEQIHMIQHSMFPIVVVVLSLVYDEVNERFCYFSYTYDEMCYILKRFEPFQLLVPVLHHMGRKVRQLDLDKTEVAFLCALHLVDSGNKHIYKELLLDSLEEYIKKKSGQVCDRNGQILLCLRDMVSTNHIHQQAVNALLSPGSKYAHLEIPQLFKESFIGMDD